MYTVHVQYVVFNLQSKFSVTIISFHRKIDQHNLNTYRILFKQTNNIKLLLTYINIKE